MSLPNSFCGGRRARTIQRYLLYAQLALGDHLVLDGRVASRQEHLEMAISLYDPERHRPLAFRYAGLMPG